MSHAQELVLGSVEILVLLVLLVLEIFLPSRIGGCRSESVGLEFELEREPSLLGFTRGSRRQHHHFLGTLRKQRLGSPVWYGTQGNDNDNSGTNIDQTSEDSRRRHTGLL